MHPFPQAQLDVPFLLFLKWRVAITTKKEINNAHTIIVPMFSESH